MHTVAIVLSVAEDKADEFAGHHEHDSHPDFKRWDGRAERFQIAEPLAFGGDTVVKIGR